MAGNTGRTCIPIRMASYNILGKIYHWLTEIIIFVFPFISLLIMNSVLIHTLRKRSKQILLGPRGQGQTEGQGLKIKNSDKQIFTILLLVTFAFLFLNIPTRSLVFYLNFLNYAGLHLFYHAGQKSYFTDHGINFFLYVMSGKKFRTDLKNLFVSKTPIKNTSL